MHRRSSLRHSQRAAKNEYKLQGRLRQYPLETSIKQPPNYHLPTTFEGCLQEHDRIGELQKQYIREMDTLAGRNQVLTSRMQEIERSLHLSCVAEVEVQKKNLFTPREMAKDVTNRLAKGFPINSELSLSTKEDGKNCHRVEGPQISDGIYFPEVRTSELTDIRSKVMRCESNFQ